MMARSQDRRFLSHSSIIAAAAGGLLIGALCGCEDSKRAGSGDSAMSGSRTAIDAGGRVQQMQSELDRKYTVGPTGADALGYRPVWNVKSYGGNSLVSRVWLLGDSLFVIDASNSLTRVLAENGRVNWNWPVAQLGDRILGVGRSIVGDVDYTLVMTEGDVHVFDTTNGSQIERQRLERVGASEPLVVGDGIIYGSVNGDVLWYRFTHGARVRGNSIYGAVSTIPVQRGPMILLGSDRGELAAYAVADGGKYWSFFARGPMTAAPAVTSELVYVTSQDQYVYCLDRRDGSVLWKRLHATPLSSTPVVVGDSVFISTPDMGMVCYDALPNNDLDGHIIWSNDKVQGGVVAEHGGRLFVWDAEARTMTLVDPVTGDVASVVSLPKVKQLIVSKFGSGDIYAVGDSGMVTRLVPRS